MSGTRICGGHSSGLAGLSTHPHQDALVGVAPGQHSNCAWHVAVACKCIAWIDDVWQGDLWKNNWASWSCQGAKKYRIGPGESNCGSSKMHVDCLGAFLFDGVIDDATCSAVVSL